MTTLREAAQQALETLEALQGGCTDSDDGTVEAITVWCPEVIDDLRAALAEPVQEPVAWSYELATTRLEHGYDGWEHRITRYKPNVPEGSIRNLTPLYTAPPQRKPLTEEEIDSVWDGHVVPVFGKNGINPIVFARAIERAHHIT